MPSISRGAITVAFHLGIAFASVGQDSSKKNTPLAIESKVVEVSKDLRDKLKLDAFYKKHLDCAGLPILSSDKVSDKALVEAGYLIRQMLSEREEILQAMVKKGCRFVVMAPTEMTTDVPEQRHLKNDPKTDWDKRARGLGGRITSCGEENLLNLRGDRYRNENILIHEFSHAIHRYGIGSLDAKFDGRLREIYKAAKDGGLWKDTYAASNHSEYWAEGVQSYFDCNNPPNKGVHNDVNTREELEKYDKRLFDLIEETFKRPAYRYVRYDKRNPAGKEEQAGPALTTELMSGIALRNIGPALTPGRVGDIAIDPRDRSVWYIAVASGGVWKTTNRGISWKPIFDSYRSYSIGCVTLDPKNPDIVWLGTGENQSQRSVSFGDGIYKSTDAGKTWTNVGLKSSEHIAKVLIDPRNSDVVYVASQGPLWSPGGDRGLFKTTDGGKTWKPILQISENTGITDVVLDPRDPDLLYAAAYQRRRNVGVQIGGGPEAGIHKSTDGGKTWTKLTKGLPAVDLGRIALAVSPQKPDVVYAHVTAAKREGGFFRSSDCGETWVKQSGQGVTDPNYYGEIYPDPHQFDRVYMVDMQIQKTEDGGKTFQRMNWAMHVDHHAMSFDPGDPKHLLVGNDGGLYETHDGGSSWRHFNNMPTPQYYRVSVDNALPFYNVYAGAQDNGSAGGPSRTRNRVGIRTSDWGGVGGGDGFQARVDPGDPDTVYTMSQYGSLVRLNRQTGTGTPIKPRDKGVRWNWDSPFIISSHSPKQLYLAGSQLYRSEDRGDSWKAISPDLTRQLDRSKVEVMGKVWGPDAVTRNLFTTDLGVASALAESPLKDGLLYFGTDDGLIQFTEDNGSTWRKIERFPGLPNETYVSDLCASNHAAGTVYAAFNNWQRGDFKPYLLKSSDLGKTWTSIAGNLPDRHAVWCVVEDPINKDLLFAGTEFGLFVTVDGGKNWAQFRNGVPTIAFRDLEFQRREGDLVAATFGRGIFILDDFTPLRRLTPSALAREGLLFPPRRTQAVAELPFARSGGEFAAPNPPSGPLITYYLRNAVTGMDAKVQLTVKDADGKTVREIAGPATAGVHRVAWELRTGGMGKRPATSVKPGKYTLTLAKVVGGVTTVLGEPQTCELVPLESPPTGTTRP